MKRAPRRIQLRRTKGWRKPAGAVVVSRPSRWGNPFVAAMHGMPSDQPIARILAVDAFKSALHGGHLGVTTADVRAELRGKDLACWCPLDQPCHADVLLEVANR